MPILATIIAKILALTEGVLDYFVEVTPGATIDHCATTPTLAVDLTNCGAEFVDTVAQLVNGIAEFIGPILVGLQATEPAGGLNQGS